MYLIERFFDGWIGKYITAGNVKPAEWPRREPLVLLEHLHFAHDLLALNSTLTDDDLCLEILDMFNVAY